MRLRVTYDRPEDLVAEHDEQMTKGGLLVRGEAPADLALFAPIEVEFTGSALRTPIVVQGQVVQVAAGVGVAVAFDPAPLAAAVQSARVGTRAAIASPPPSPKNEAAAKIQLALHGNKDERGRILRDPNRMLHPYVLKNPNLGIDEVLSMAKMTTVSPDALAQIAERPEWAQRPEIALALVRNPKVPTPLACRLVEFVTPADLRQLAKDTKTRPQVQQAARKKVL
jgi:hypothetical protein